MSRHETHLDRMVNEVRSRPVKYKEAGQYPSLEALRARASTEIHSKHSAYMVDVQKKIETAGIRWHFDKETRQLYEVDIASGEIIKK